MKKLMILMLAVLLTAAFTMPVSALENKFGGYWRTRMYTNQDFSGDDSESMDWTGVDMRARIYYTAILNDDLKFVSKFEMDTVWGDSTTGSKGKNFGGIGSDGTTFEIKNVYADFNVASLNVKMGTQGITLCRGFIFDDDFTGLVVTMKNEGITIPFVWMKAWEGNNTGMGQNKRDLDFYAVSPIFNLSDQFVLNPFVLYGTSDNANDFLEGYEDTTLYYVAINGDLNLDMASIWFTGIYEGGDADMVGGGSTDFAGMLAAVGGSVNMDTFGIHGQFFYASGDDDATDSDMDNFWVPKGQSYYWAEIMGYGIFDDRVSNAAPADQIGNIMALNVGASVKPTDEMSLSLDLWHARLAEDDANGEDELGTEIDVAMKYKLIPGMNVDLVAAYLLAGDATTGKASNDADPWEVGAQFSLSF